MKILKRNKYKLPLIGKLLKDRDTIASERDNLLILLNNQSPSKNPINFNKIITKHRKSISGIEKYIKGKKRVFDVGTGPEGSHWWNLIDKDATITGIDYYFFPDTIPPFVEIYKSDASKLHLLKPGSKLEQYISKEKFSTKSINWKNKFDLVVANHVLEHVENPDNLIKGISNIIQKNGIVYVGFPDCRNFTDIFYHLVHPDGGGHIQQLTNDIVQKLFEDNGFKLLECNIWPDGWGWFQHSYKPQNFGVKYINQSHLNYMSDIFRKELTSNKGYFYGWEMVFEKKD